MRSARPSFLALDEISEKKTYGKKAPEALSRVRKDEDEPTFSVRFELRWKVCREHSAGSLNY